MNFTEGQITDHAQNVMRKQEQIETLEALLATHEAMGAQPDSSDVKELKERIDVARRQLMAIRQKRHRFTIGQLFLSLARAICSNASLSSA